MRCINLENAENNVLLRNMIVLLWLYFSSQVSKVRVLSVTGTFDSDSLIGGYSQQNVIEIDVIIFTITPKKESRVLVSVTNIKFPYLFDPECKTTLSIVVLFYSKKSSAKIPMLHKHSTFGFVITIRDKSVKVPAVGRSDVSLYSGYRRRHHFHKSSFIRKGLQGCGCQSDFSNSGGCSRQ